MTVRELRNKLVGLPEDAIIKVAGDVGCDECNPEALDYFVYVDTVDFYADMAQLPYPNNKFNKWRPPGEQVVVIR